MPSQCELIRHETRNLGSTRKATNANHLEPSHRKHVTMRPLELGYFHLVQFTFIAFRILGPHIFEK